MSRLPKLPPEHLDDGQRALYDAITGGPRAQDGSPFRLTGGDGALEGPFNAMLLQPAFGAALQALGSAVRYETTLSARAREIAILLVAHHWQSSFEIYAHEAVGRAAGLTGAELAALRAGPTANPAANPAADSSADPADDPAPTPADDPAELLVADTTRALLAHGDLSDEEFEAARTGLGLPALFELTTLTGYYATLALQLRVFRVGAPDPLDTTTPGRQDSD